MIQIRQPQDRLPRNDPFPLVGIESANGACKWGFQLQVGQGRLRGSQRQLRRNDAPIGGCDALICQG